MTALAAAAGAVIGGATVLVVMLAVLGRHDRRVSVALDRERRRAKAFEARAIERDQERAAVERQNALLRERLAAKRPCDGACCQALRRELDATRRIANIQADELHTLRGEVMALRASHLRHAPVWEAS